MLEGGGVKGIGLVGALQQLEDAGYQFQRVAGTSAGAIVGSLVAAGVKSKALETIMQGLDYTRFQDEGVMDRLGGVAGKGASLLFEKGIYEGEFLRQWLTARLEEAGVRTFADLKLTEDWAQELPPEQRYKLVVITTDVSGGRLTRLPWDYARFGLNPDEQSVADAVRASMSLPFFYEPFKLGKNLFVDGALLSNFPVDIFGHHETQPTIGIKLSARPEANLAMHETDNVLEFSQAIFSTMLNAHDQMHLDDPCVIDRTVFVDTGTVKVADFDITKEQQAFLFENGKKAAEKFLAHWDYEKHLAECPSENDEE